MKVFFYTSFALLAFAFNSILCRLALGTNAIDAAGFTTIRLISGAAALLVISSFFGNNNAAIKQGNWLSAFFLFAYAICFSFAYIGLTTGTGALILFGSVQATMIIAALAGGERPQVLEWLGLFAALAGLIYLVLPGLAAPPLFSSILMALAGIAWGFYTLRGKGSANPLAETTGNFIRTIPLIITASLPFLSQFQMSQRGFAFAIISGAITSGVGYSIWYAALKFHTAARAAILQLSVPVLAAIGGVILLSENVTIRLLVAAILILGGISLAVFAKKK
jgi:drug/metabolite transporter (DMT)-like permease